MHPRVTAWPSLPVGVFDAPAGSLAIVVACLLAVRFRWCVTGALGGVPRHPVWSDGLDTGDESGRSMMGGPRTRPGATVIFVSCGMRVRCFAPSHARDVLSGPSCRRIWLGAGWSGGVAPSRVGSRLDSSRQTRLERAGVCRVCVNRSARGARRSGRTGACVAPVAPTGYLARGVSNLFRSLDPGMRGHTVVNVVPGCLVHATRLDAGQCHFGMSRVGL